MLTSSVQVVAVIEFSLTSKSFLSGGIRGSLIIYKSAIRKEEVGSSLRGGKAFSGTQGSKKQSLVFSCSGVRPTRKKITMDFLTLLNFVK